MAKKNSFLVPDTVWDHYKSLVSQFIDTDSGRQEITWKKYIDIPLPYGEDSGAKYIDIPLQVLIGYNSFRTWPINKTSVAGETDEQNMAIYISANLLRELGYLDSSGYWNMDRSRDRFVVNGILYKMSGDTQVSQAKDTPLLFQVILKREEDQRITPGIDPPPIRTYTVFTGILNEGEEVDFTKMESYNVPSLPFTHIFNLNNQRSVFALPKAMGLLTGIHDANKLNYLASYLLSEMIFNEAYYVYTLEYPTIILDFTQTYK